MNDLDRLAEGYDRDLLIDFFSQLGGFDSDGQIDDPESEAMELLGSFRLGDGSEIPLLAVPVSNAMKKQRAPFEEVARFLSQRVLDGALVIFHDGRGTYRMAFIYATAWRGRRKPRYSDYRRASLLVESGGYNKTFRQQMERLLELEASGRDLSLEVLKEIFSLEAVSKTFYKVFAEVFENKLVPGIVGYTPRERVRDFALAFVARVLFLGFVAKKGWLGGDERFLPSLYARYRESGSRDRFYQDWLEPLFFSALKGSPGSKPDAFRHLPEDVRRAYREAPYLNGELFNRKPGVDDQGAFIADQAIEDFFDFVFAYNFTIEENTASDADLELNPEFLGLILEKLVNTVGVDGKATELGAHYTPRVEVDLMVRLALAEYLARQGIPLEGAYRLMQGEAEVLSPELRDRARMLLKEAKILDPAVGSGAFLLGALHVLEEALERLGEPRTLSLRRALMQNLYGVDALPWAVWMAELRLWLAYFVELDDKARVSGEPLLPSLGLKVRQGDSVLQTIDKTPLPVRLPPNDAALKKPGVKKAFDELVRAKDDYFHNRGVSLEAVEENERVFLGRYIEALLVRGGQKQALLEGVHDPSKQLDEVLERARALLAQKKRPFVYFLDFAEVLLGPRCGFDIVVGNPPYLSQQNLQDLFGRFSPRDYKTRLQEAVQEDLKRFGPYTHTFPPPKPAGRSDLYTYFYARSLALLHEKGVHAFVVSNSWLDVQYGAWLQRVFLEAAPLRYVIENRVKRSFEADVNTVITVAHALRKQKLPEDWPLLFIVAQKPFEETDLLEEALMASIEVGFEPKGALA